MLACITLIYNLVLFRQVGQGALPREPEQSEKDRGTEQCELLTFTDLGKKVPWSPTIVDHNKSFCLTKRSTIELLASSLENWNLN